MAAGKTTLGRELADWLDWDFVDLDHCLEQQAGRTISQIFAQEGEPYFRQLEREILEQTATLEKPSIIATGGGLPCFGDNLVRMEELGTTVYLQVAPEELLRRIRQDRADRPLVRDRKPAELAAFVRELLQQREAFYRQAEVVVTEPITLRQVVAALLLAS